MELCDFSNVMKIIREYISDARALSQTDLLYEVFDAFMDDEENADYDFDNALVCRWMNGQAAITPRISKYYMNKDKEGILVSDINKNVNSNVFIPNRIPVTQRAYLLGHSVETNERFYSHMKTESLVDLKDILNRACQANGAPDAQNESIHTHTHTKIVDFGQIKNTGKPINTRLSGI